MTMTKQAEILDCELIHDLFNLFSQCGTVVPLLQRLCWNNEKKQSVKGPGLYCFTEVQNKLTSCSTFLYVGRTQTLNKRFNEHRRAWLNKYVLANPKYHLQWGYICAENLSNDFGSVQQVETWCWRNKEKLGLSLGTKLIGTDYESD